MVDRRKKMHRDIIATVSKAYSGVLQSFIPYLALIEKMGIYRAPVAEFSPESVAARSYQNLWDKVQKTVLSQSKRH
jgi:nitrogenase subunit NifH